MFGSFRRHQRWIWMLGVIVIIPSFVIYFSPTGKSGGGGGRVGKVDLGSFNGQPISREDFLAAQKETKLNHFMRSGGREWPTTDENGRKTLERDTIFRVCRLDKIRQLGIHVSERAVARAARERLGEYPPDKFEHDFLLREGLTLEDFERYMRHEAAIQQLIGVAAATAKMISPREAESLYRKEHEQVSTEVAGFWPSNYLSKVEVKPDAISKYYSNHLANYRIPERIQVAYVEFSASNFLAEAEKDINQKTNLNSFADGEYIRRGGTNTFKDTNGVPLAEKVAKEQIKNEQLTFSALMHARRKAADFGNKLLDPKQQTFQTSVTNGLAQKKSFDEICAQAGIKPVQVPPFSSTTNAIAGLDERIPVRALQEIAFELKPGQASPFRPLAEGGFIAYLKERIPVSEAQVKAELPDYFGKLRIYRQ